MTADEICLTYGIKQTTLHNRLKKHNIKSENGYYSLSAKQLNKVTVAPEKLKSHRKILMIAERIATANIPLYEVAAELKMDVQNLIPIWLELKTSGCVVIESKLSKLK